MCPKNRPKNPPKRDKKLPKNHKLAYCHTKFFSLDTHCPPCKFDFKKLRLPNLVKSQKNKNSHAISDWL